MQNEGEQKRTYSISGTFERTKNPPIAWPPVLLCATFSRTACPNNFTLNTVLSWLLRNKTTRYELDWTLRNKNNRLLPF